MTGIREHLELQKKTTAPSAAESDDRILTQTGLSAAIRAHQTRPNDAHVGQSRAAWVEFDPVPKLVVYKDGKFYETTLTPVP